MKTFNIMMYYNEDEYGKAFFDIEADSKEEAWSKLKVLISNEEIYNEDIEFYAKGGAGVQFAFDCPILISEEKISNCGDPIDCGEYSYTDYLLEADGTTEKEDK